MKSFWNSTSRYVAIAISLVAWIIGLFMLESYHCGFGMVLGIIPYILLMIGFFKENDKLIPLFLCFTISTLIISLVSIAIGLRVIKDESTPTVRIVSTFYPMGRCLASGESVDTLRKLPRCYVKEDKKIDIYFEDFFVLHVTDSLSVLFDRDEVILTGYDIHFSKKEYGHGPITLCHYRSEDGQRKIVDLDGKEVNKINYKLRIKEIPADPGYVPTW